MDVLLQNLIERNIMTINAKNVKLLNTEPNFFTASNKHGFIVMHLEEFLELPISKQRKIIKNYR